MTAVRVLVWATLATAGVFPFGLCGLLLQHHRGALGGPR